MCLVRFLCRPDNRLGGQECCALCKEPIGDEAAKLVGDTWLHNFCSDACTWHQLQKFITVAGSSSKEIPMVLGRIADMCPWCLNPLIISLTLIIFHYPQYADNLIDIDNLRAVRTFAGPPTQHTIGGMRTDRCWQRHHLCR